MPSPPQAQKLDTPAHRAALDQVLNYWKTLYDRTNSTAMKFIGDACDHRSLAETYAAMEVSDPSVEAFFGDSPPAATAFESAHLATLGGQPPQPEVIDTLLTRFTTEEAESEVVYDLARAWPKQRIDELLRIAVRPGPDRHQMAIIDGISDDRSIHPTARQAMLPILISALENASDLPSSTAGPLVSLAISMGAVDAAEAIERAFAADLIDVGFCGDWEQVRDDLGVDGLGLPMPAKPQNSIAELQAMAARANQNSRQRSGSSGNRSADLKRRKQRLKTLRKRR